MPQADVEALTWSVRVERLAQRAGPALPAFAGQAEETQAVSLRSVFDPMLGARVDYVILRREALPSGFHADGPALVTEAQTTTVVPSAFSLSVLEDGSLMLSRKPAARSLP
jgi:N-methylhydantoinase A